MSQLDISYINSLAESYTRTIADAENRYYGGLKTAVNAVIDSGRRIILLAGPSGAGKTTTSQILRDAFISAGHPCELLPLDDFYRDSDDPDYPRLSDGSNNLECPEALCLNDVKGVISSVLSSGTAAVPVFDFKTAKRKPEKRSIDLSGGGVLIIEGLHALNPLISQGIESEKLFKIFVSVSTNINEGDTRLLSGKKIRFMRRLSRDRLYRASETEQTLSLWRQVLAAENIYLYPYKETAQLKFDTFHAFEPGVLKSFVLPALAESTDGLALEIRRALEKIKEIPLSAVPQSSLIREFVPGGKYEPEI